MSTTADRLSFDDAQILRLESAAIAGHTCKIAIVEPPADGRVIDIDGLRRHVEARMGRVRRCRQRVAFVPLGLARPLWVDYPDFDIREHVRLHESNGAVDRAGLLQIAAVLMAERLDHTRPLWRMDLVGPLENGGSAIVWRIHHCMADGVTAQHASAGRSCGTPGRTRPRPSRARGGPSPSRRTCN